MPSPWLAIIQKRSSSPCPSHLVPPNWLPHPLSPNGNQTFPLFHRSITSSPTCLVKQKQRSYLLIVLTTIRSLSNLAPPLHSAQSTPCHLRNWRPCGSTSKTTLTKASSDTRKPPAVLLFCLSRRLTAVFAFVWIIAT